MPSITVEINGREVQVECSERNAQECAPFQEALEALERFDGFVITPKGTRLWLLPCRGLWKKAAELFDAGNPGFLSLASSAWGIRLVCENVEALRERGILEAALLRAFTSVTINHTGDRYMLDFLFRTIDRAGMRRAGDSLPGPGPFTIFRGVAGHGAARRVCGYSWSADFERAKWFALRFADGLNLADPAVFRATVAEADVYAYDNGRNEQEFIVDPACFERPGGRPMRVWRQRDEAGMTPA